MYTAQGCMNSQPSISHDTSYLAGTVATSALAVGLSTELGRKSVERVVSSTMDCFARNPAVGIGVLLALGVGYLLYKAMETETRVEVGGIFTLEPGRRWVLGKSIPDPHWNPWSQKAKGSRRKEMTYVTLRKL